MPGSDIRVALADDHELFRDGMSAILALAAGIAVVAEASDAEGAVAIASLHLPDILLLDVEMPGRPLPQRCVVCAEALLSPG